MLELNQIMNEIPLPTCSDYFILATNRKNKNAILTIMTAISKEEEEKIDKLKYGVLNLERGDKTFNIEAKDVYCYGEVDLEDEETLDTIDSFKFLNYLEFGGLRIPSRYNYRNHTCRSPRNKILWTETWTPSDIVLIAHGSLGKPERVVLFSKIIKI